MPDAFVAADTSYKTDYLKRLAGKNILNSFALEYFDKNRTILNTRYKTFDDYRDNFFFHPEDIHAFIRKGEAEGVKYDEGESPLSFASAFARDKSFSSSTFFCVTESVS